MSEQKDITKHLLKDGDIGLYRENKYLAIAKCDCFCNGCVFVSVEICDRNIYCTDIDLGINLIFTKI